MTFCCCLHYKPLPSLTNDLAITMVPEAGSRTWFESAVLRWAELTYCNSWQVTCIRLRFGWPNAVPKGVSRLRPQLPNGEVVVQPPPA